MILNAISAVEHGRWLDATRRFAADISKPRQLYTFSVEICGMEVQEFTLENSAAKVIHGELVRQGHC
eukprot:COSAG01_NODE_60934_length_292_cov_0.663212_1_plen_66_part_10